MNQKIRNNNFFKFAMNETDKEDKKAILNQLFVKIVEKDRKFTAIMTWYTYASFSHCN